MAYNTESLIGDLQKRPVPQYWNAVVNKYEVVQGANGASRVLLYDTSGNPLLTTSNPGQVAVTNFSAMGLKTFATGSKTVGTTPVELFAGASAMSGRRFIQITCTGDVEIYIGPSGVTTSTGYPVLPGEHFSLSLDPLARLFAVATSNQTVFILEGA